MARRSNTPLVPIFLLGAMLTGAVAVCIVLAKQSHPAEALLGAVMTLVGAGVVVALSMRSSATASADPELGRTLADLRDKVDELADTVREMATHNALSSDARRVIFRKQERDLLVQAIDEDIAEGQWDAAAVLVTELESRLGYTAEAAAFHARIKALRDARAAQKFGEAFLSTGAADGPEISIPAPIPAPAPDASRLATKVELERSFMAAANEGRAEAAMSILAELDQYLTPGEAEPLREIARGVIAKTRDAMGEQFKSALQARRWPDAVAVGEQIIGRFPNTRMAAEVREVIDTLRARV